MGQNNRYRDQRNQAQTIQMFINLFTFFIGKYINKKLLPYSR